MTEKGINAGKCCCPGCRVLPYNSSLATAALQATQSLCCYCIPIAICAVADVAGAIDPTSAIFFACEGATLDDDRPVLYAGNMRIYGEDVTVRFGFRTDESGYCYFWYSIVEWSESAEVLIDHTDESIDAGCIASGRTTTQCCDFLFSWTVPITAYGAAFTLNVAPATVMEVASAINCRGCSCICEKACFSVYTRTSEDFTYSGSNEVVTATIETRSEAGCDGGPTTIYGYDIVWERTDGWSTKIKGTPEVPVSSHVVNSGTEVTLPCSIAPLTWYADDKVHTVTGGGEVDYHFTLDEGEVANQLKWIGRSEDETSTITFSAYNWTTTSWDVLTTKAGYPTTTDINRGLTEALTVDHTKPDAPNLGRVSIRVSATDGVTLITDMIRIVHSQCCAMTLIPASGITPTYLAQPLKRVLEYPNACPGPSLYWEFTDGTTDYLVNWDCAWCGTQCGTSIPPCCNKPIPKFLTATVTLPSCTTCSDPIEVLLIREPAGSIWGGTAGICAEDPVTITLSCGGSPPEWNISFGGVGSCTFTDVATAATCDPLLIEFSGANDTGLGCCGPNESPFITTTPITIDVTE